MIDNQKLIELYEDGKSCREIADYYSITSQAVSKRLRKLGISTRRVAGYYTPQELEAVRDEISKLRSQNFTIAEIARIVNLSHTSVWCHLKVIQS